MVFLTCSNGRLAKVYKGDKKLSHWSKWVKAEGNNPVTFSDSLYVADETVRTFNNEKKCLNHLLRKSKRLVSFFLFYFPFNYFSHFLCRPSKRVVPNLPSQFSFDLFSNSRPTCQP